MENDTFFRREVQANSSRRLEGDVLLGTPISWTILSYIAAAAVLFAFAFAVSVTYSRRESVSGWLKPRGGLIRVTARPGGQVTALNTIEGETITAGERIAELRLSTEVGATDSGADLEQAAKSEIAASAVGTRAALDKLASDRMSAVSRKTALIREREEVVKQVETLDSQLSLAKIDLERAEKLSAQGFMAHKDLEVRQRAVLIAEHDVAQGRASKLALEREIEDLRASIAQAPLLMEQAKAQASEANALLSEKLLGLRAQSGYVLAAPVTGKIAALPIERGQTLAPGALAAVIIPIDSPLEAELYVPSRAAGFIRPGQKVYLRYQAFPYQKFGAGEGEVRVVSKTVMSASETGVPGLNIQEPVFRVKVTLKQDYIQAYGQKVLLQPGMLLNADIIVDQRKLLEWLLDPIYAVGKR